jgi:hypothetical protein
MHEDTHILNSIDLGTQSSTTFRAYLERYGLSLLDVALAAQVRLLSTWNIQQGIPVRRVHAASIRAGLYELTGVPYTAPIATIPEDIVSLVDHSLQQPGRKDERVSR